MERLELIAPPDAPPPAEAVPILRVDCQAVSPYFWFVVRAWGPEGHSRLVAYGHRDTWEEIREAQLTHGVTDNHVGIDMIRHLSRKDIAALIDPRMTPDVVRRNERRLGLDKARIRLNRRVILYRREQALNALRAKGFDV